jgi:hypothetical protein
MKKKVNHPTKDHATLFVFWVVSFVLLIVLVAILRAGQ